MQNLSQQIIGTSSDVLLERARVISKSLQSRSLEFAQTRHIPPDIIAQLRDAGLMSIMRPACFGGPGLGMDLMLHIAFELAKGDGSTGWVYSVLNSHDHLIGLYSEDVQREFWTSEQNACASSFVPAGTPIREGNGWRLSGKWSFCSGIDYSGWVVLGAVTGVIPGNNPIPDLHLFLLKKSDVSVVDDWHVMGLCGTGSKSVVIDNIYVPDAYVLRNLDVANGETPGAILHQDAPLYRNSIWPLFCFTIIVSAIGVARGAYHYALNDSIAKAARKDPMFEIRRATIQTKLARVSALIDAAEGIFMQGLSTTYGYIERDERIPLELRVRNRRDQTYLLELCREAAAVLMSLAGGRGIREDGIVQRCFRDIYAVSAHPASNWDSASSSYGSVVLGGPVTEMFY